MAVNAYLKLVSLSNTGYNINIEELKQKAMIINIEIKVYLNYIS